ncbi:MAG: hypothetical protein HKN23_17115 [Verrucomicrobiales bacterium]|nr:hypothetical protein [Verrucomicrobiales bacterium]
MNRHRLLSKLTTISVALIVLLGAWVGTYFWLKRTYGVEKPGTATEPPAVEIWVPLRWHDEIYYFVRPVMELDNLFGSKEVTVNS